MSLDLAGRRAARLAKLGMDVAWWLTIALAGIAMLLFLASPLLLRSASGIDNVAVEVAGVNDWAPRSMPIVLADTSRAADAVLEERDATYHLEFRARRWAAIGLVFVWFLPLFGVVLTGVHLLRSFMRDVLADEVFTVRNATRLAWLGWLVLAAGVVAPLIETLSSWLVLRYVDVGGALAPVFPKWSGGFMWLGAVLLALSSAWRYGAELQQERDLTV